MSKVVKYLEIAEKIKRKILGNIYKTNELLPSEKMLEEKFGVSRLTVRKALEILEEEGYINVKAGKGSFVNAISNNVYKMDLEIADIITCKYEKIELISAKMIVPDIHLVYHLMVEPGSRIVCIDWVLKNNNKPIAFETRYMPYSNGLIIEEEDLTYTSMIDMICKKFLYYEFEEHIEIKGIGLDDTLKEHMKTMDFEASSFMLIEHTIFNENGKALGYSNLRIDSRYCEIKGRARM